MKNPEQQALTYTAIPPTTDLNYWRVKTLDNKTKSFTPIDPDLHRSLLIAARGKRRASTPLLLPPIKKRYETQHIKYR